MKIKHPIQWLRFLFIGCLVASGNAWAQFGSSLPITLEVNVTKTTLPFNFFGMPPQVGNQFISTITVLARNGNGTLISSQDEIVGMAIRSGLGSGVLVFLDGDPAHEDDNGNELLFRSINLDLNSGRARAHLFSSGFTNTGSVVVVVSVQDPNGGPTVSTQVTIDIASGSNTAVPSLIQFQRTATGQFTLFTAGIGGTDQIVFNILLVDDGGFPIPDPVAEANNIRVRLGSGRPNAGEFLTGSGTEGAQSGDTIDVRSSGGVAQVVFHSGDLPGNVVIEALADRTDNDVSNGIEIPISDSTTIPIDDGVIRSFSYSGPFIDAAVSNENILAINGGTDTLTQDGIYSRGIEVLASSRFGNPPIEGTAVIFHLIDGPLIPGTYPNCGHGEFMFTGTDANPDEGTRFLSTPLGGSTFNDIEVGCQLYLEGPDPDQRMGRIITAILSPHDLEVNNPYPEQQDTGFTGIYTIGCPPFLGNIENAPGGLTAITDPLGRILTHLNYPASAIGHIFKASIEAQGGQVNQVVEAHYLGEQQGTLRIVSPSLLRVEPDGSLQAVLVVELTDGSDPSTGNPVTAPVPAELILVDIDIFDPIDQLLNASLQELALTQALAIGTRTEATTARAEADAALIAAVGARIAAEAGANTAILNVNDPNDPTDDTVALCADLTAPTLSVELLALLQAPGNAIIRGLIEACFNADALDALAVSLDLTAILIEDNAETAERNNGEQLAVVGAVQGLADQTPDPVVTISSPSQSPCPNESEVVIRTDAAGRATVLLDIQNVSPELDGTLLDAIDPDSTAEGQIGPGFVDVRLFTVNFGAPVVEVLNIQTAGVAVPTSVADGGAIAP